MHGSPSDPPHPTFQGEEEIKEIPNIDIEKPTTEREKSRDGQPGRGDHD